ncbi:type II toxin-antitoxin system RelE family toxin [Methanothrix sp.]|uniref:type II toxin-antitoxin system RelE family toxin n=1 Tax=Methanothrix sp. TaxID=90426 RepID=UPI003C746B89
MIYQLIIQPRAQRFLKKLRKKNPDAASEIVMDIFELKNDPKTSLDALIDSLTDKEIDELNADEGGDEEPMPFEEFCRKAGIKLQK